MQSTEPTLENIQDYKGKGSIEKRLTVWIVALSGLLVDASYGILIVNSSVSDTLDTKEAIGIFK